MIHSPMTKKELMRYLGSLGYYGSLCHNFSTVVAPLTDLLKDKTKFIWSSSCASAFENVKSLLCSLPILLAPCFDEPFTVTLVIWGLELFFSSVMQMGWINRSVSFRENLMPISVIILLLKRKH